MRRLRVSAVILTFFSCAGWAHQDYERPERSISSPAHKELRLLKHYTDGLFGPDPVKLVLRSGDGALLAETGYGRDVSVICPEEARCIVFVYLGSLALMPRDVWELREAQLQPADSLGLKLLGIAVDLRDHALAYLLGALLLFVPVAMFRKAKRRAEKIAAAVLTLPYAFVWLYVFVAVVQLSMTMILLLAAIPAAGWVGLRRKRAAQPR
ncbi:MAG: hypothetical protein H7Y16_09540 [Candidatus Parcubacteria bacterium]|nr:hypothetical protein [Burkholderiales bacterium]